MTKLPRIKGVNRVTRRLPNKTRVIEHYTTRSRGAVKFWREPQDGFDPAAYVRAYDAAKAAQPATASHTVGQLIVSFLASGEFKALADRTRSDYRKWAERFRERFESAPVVLLEDRRFRADLLEWRDQWSHSPKQAQYAWSIAKRIASWGVDRGVITSHVIKGGTNLYRADRAEMVWTEADVEKFRAVAPLWVRRILILAISTGLRVGDLCRLSRSHLVDGAIQIRTSKRSRVATIPILPETQEVIDQTPAGQLLILTSERGRPLTPHRASEGVRQWALKAGINPDLRLQDCRGTAATRLVRAGVEWDRIAVAMGWSIKYAVSVVEHYVALDPTGARGVAEKLERVRNENLQRSAQQAGPSSG